MLAYVLAIVIAIGSFSFYMAAFFVPEIHRRQDFVWSGVGMFYAVVLWFCAGRITGAVLLGQIASVALLGWLGWQTLELRRDLTPDYVRTPVSWADLQRWQQTAQQALSKYLQMGSLLAGVKAIGADLRTGVAAIRNRIAGPRGEVRSRPDIPPLRRSPAYEFETETGQGESVPSEFASVPTQPRTPPSINTAQQAAAASQKSESVPSATSEALESPLTAAVTKQSDPKTEPESVPSAIAVETAMQAETSEPAAPTQAAKSVKSAPDVTAPSPDPKPPSSPASKPAAAAPNRLVIFKNWLGELWQGWRRPKPQRTVIEIPPRAPSIPRSSEAAERPAKSSQSSQSSKRAVIDIPPRPPSIPRPPKPAQTGAGPATKAPVTEPDSNWVDVGDAQSQPAEPAEYFSAKQDSDPPPPSEADTPLSPPPAPVPPADIADEPETNWPDDESETNWPND